MIWYFILTIILPALLLIDLKSKGYFLQDTPSEQNKSFFVHPPEVQPRRQETYEMSACKVERFRPITLPDLIIAMEDSHCSDDSNYQMNMDFEEIEIEAKVKTIDKCPFNEASMPKIEC